MKNNLLIFITFLSLQSLQAQFATLNTVKTRVLYQWIENKLEIVVANTACANIIVKAKYGTIKGKACNYTYVVSNDSTRIDYISIGVKRNNKIKWLKEEAVPVKKLPDPYTQIGSLEGGNIPINYFKSQIGIRLFSNYMDMGWCENSYGVKFTHWNIQIMRNSKEVFSDTSHSDIYFNEHTLNFIGNSLEIGDTVIFSNIGCIIFEKELRKLRDMKFIMTN